MFDNNASLFFLSSIYNYSSRQEEIFGPILPVIKVSSVDQAIAYCKGRPTPLAAYIFEQDTAIRERWLEQVESGGACVNDCMNHA